MPGSTSTASPPGNRPLLAAMMRSLARGLTLGAMGCTLMGLSASGPNPLPATPAGVPGPAVTMTLVGP